MGASFVKVTGALERRKRERRRDAVTDARSSQKRKEDKREQVRDFKALVKRREMEKEAKARERRPAPEAAATTEAEATARVEDAIAELSARAETLKTLKTAARESPSWDQSRGYKAHPDVMAALREFEAARRRHVETRLERALVLFAEAKGDGDFKTLESFNWYYGEGFGAREGANAKSLSYMLGAALKTTAFRAVSEMCLISLTAERDGPVPLPVKVRAQAVAKLKEAAEFDLLESEDVEVLEALKMAQ